MEESINREVSEMLKINIVKPSESPFCSPVFIVPKKDGTNRFCVDKKLLNSHTFFDCEPMSDSDEMFLKLLLDISSFLKLICRRVIGNTS